MSEWGEGLQQREVDGEGRQRAGRGQADRTDRTDRQAADVYSTLLYSTIHSTQTDREAGRGNGWEWEATLYRLSRGGKWVI